MSTPPHDTDVPSPCIGICCLDDHEHCIGCRRTIGEITEWSSASTARRLEILRESALRPVSRSIDH
jgi:uncharacterized protein